MFTPFLLYLKKIIYLDVDHGRSWHLHVLHNKPDQPEGGLFAFINYVSMKEAAIALLCTLQYCSVLGVQLYSPALLCEAW